MSSTFGNKIKVSIFGESHGKGIGVVIDGLPAGETVNMDDVLAQMARRAPGRDKTATPRKESDLPNILSGMLGDKLTGAPLCAVIENTNTRSQDYGNLMTMPRPAHSDYTAYIKYHGANDVRGGGHFSGRITAPIVFAGAICRQLLEKKNIKIAAHICQIGGISDERFDPVDIDGGLMERLSLSPFALISESAEERMRAEIEAARLDRDSVGGMVECAVTGLPAGVGSPRFDGVQGTIARIVFGIPAVKGLEFGAGFAVASLTGSQNNDPFQMRDGVPCVSTNNAGGSLGGISTGAPVLFRMAVKPTPSIAQAQTSVDLSRMEPATLEVRGRHDPCVAARAVPVAEAAMALALLDLLLQRPSDDWCQP